MLSCRCPNITCNKIIFTHPPLLLFGGLQVGLDGVPVYLGQGGLHRVDIELACKGGERRINPLLPSVQNMTRLAKNFDFNFRRDHKKKIL